MRSTRTLSENTDQQVVVVQWAQVENVGGLVFYVREAISLFLCSMTKSREPTQEITSRSATIRYVGTS